MGPARPRLGTRPACGGRGRVIRSEAPILGAGRFHSRDLVEATDVRNLSASLDVRSSTVCVTGHAAALPTLTACPGAALAGLGHCG